MNKVNLEMVQKYLPWVELLEVGEQFYTVGVAGHEYRETAVADETFCLEEVIGFTLRMFGSLLPKPYRIYSYVTDDSVVDVVSLNKQLACIINNNQQVYIQHDAIEELLVQHYKDLKFNEQTARAKAQKSLKLMLQEINIEIDADMEKALSITNLSLKKAMDTLKKDTGVPTINPGYVTPEDLSRHHSEDAMARFSKYGGVIVIEEPNMLSEEQSNNIKNLIDSIPEEYVQALDDFYNPDPDLNIEDYEDDVDIDIEEDDEFLEEEDYDEMIDKTFTMTISNAGSTTEFKDLPMESLDDVLDWYSKSMACTTCVYATCSDDCPNKEMI